LYLFCTETNFCWNLSRNGIKKFCPWV
jgi:hypothetical protein